MRSKLGEIIQNLFKGKSKWFTMLFSVLVLGIFMFLITFNNVYTKTYDFERFDKAKETIRSPITIENEEETRRKTRETSQSVQDRYDISEELTEERIKYVNEIFEALENLEGEIKAERNSKEDDEDKKVKKKSEEAPLTAHEKVNRLKQILSEGITDNVSDSVLLRLIETNPDERKTGRKLLTNTLKEAFDQGVRTENIKSILTEIKDHVKYSNLDSEFKNALDELAEFALVENSFFDVEKTATARKEAESNVVPAIIRAGEIIVREGQTITNEKYEELTLVGLLNNERNVYPIIGLSLFVILLLLIMVNEMFYFDGKKKIESRKIAAIIFISIIIIGLMKIISLFMAYTNEVYYVLPIAMGVLLIRHLINERLAIVLASVYAILGCIIFNGEISGSLNMEAGIYFFFAQMGAIIFLRNLKDRLEVIRAGFSMALINIAAILLFIFLSFEKYSWIDILIQSGMGAASAFLAAILTIGLLPFFETGLGILSDMRLLQLSSPNQPLLKKILTEAPGTYHHSVMVANLSETACEAIGANGLLARVGAYYHDLGKTVRPQFFIENQLAIKNPHDFISAKRSADIIISHPYDGADMLKENKFPKEIIDIALQHHGTSLLKYFYYEEKKTNETVKEEDFRYPGPKPQTREAGVVCICDSVEAAVRSLKEPTPEKIDEIVNSIVNDRLQDGQLNECPITINELSIIRQTVCDTLKGIFHSRIQYPQEEEK